MCIASNKRNILKLVTLMLVTKTTRDTQIQ